MPVPFFFPSFYLHFISSNIHHCIQYYTATTIHPSYNTCNVPLHRIFTVFCQTETDNIHLGYLHTLHPISYYVPGYQSEPAAPFIPCHLIRPHLNSGPKRIFFSPATYKLYPSESFSCTTYRVCPFCITVRDSRVIQFYSNDNFRHSVQPLSFRKLCHIRLQNFPTVCPKQSVAPNFQSKTIRPQLSVRAYSVLWSFHPHGRPSTNQSRHLHLGLISPHTSCAKINPVTSD